MKHTKRLICLILALAVALSVIPAQVFARNVVAVTEDVVDDEIFSGNNFYIASTNTNFKENTPSDYQIRIGRGGDCAEAASVTVKFEDFSAHYGRDYTAVTDDGTKPDCPEDAIAIIDLFAGDYTVSRQQSEEELEAAAEDEDTQKQLSEAMAQANSLVYDLTGIKAADEETTLSPLEQARAAATGNDAPQQTITATDRTEAQLNELTSLFGDLVPGASVTVNFAAGETEKFLTIHPIDNKDADGDRYFTVRLINPVGAAVSSADSCSVSVIDDEEIAPCEVRFGEITQDGDTLTVNVERTGCINQITHLKLTTKQSGSAVEGRDFSGVETDVLFPMGAPATQITIPIHTACLQKDADFTLKLEPVVNAEVTEPTKRVALRATPVETEERSLKTVCVNKDEGSPKARLRATNHDGNFAGLLGYSDANGCFEMQWKASSYFGWPWWGHTEAIFKPMFPTVYYSGLRLTLEKQGEDADLGIGWGSLEQILKDDEFEWEKGDLEPFYFKDEDLTKQEMVCYLPDQNYATVGIPIDIKDNLLLRVVNEGWCMNCDTVRIYEVAPIYRWFLLELVTNSENAPKFLNANGDYVPNYDAATVGFVNASKEDSAQTLFHLDETVQLDQMNGTPGIEPFCKLTSLSTLNGMQTFELKDNKLLMNEAVMQSIMCESGITWNSDPDAGIAEYGTVQLRADFAYTDAKIRIKDSEDGNYGTLRLSGDLCPAREETYDYHRGDIVYITCDVDPAFADQIEFVGVEVRAKTNESDINWLNPITIEAVDGGLYLENNRPNRLENGYYEITPIFNFKYNTVTVRVAKDALDRFDQSYGIFADVTPKTVNYNGVTYLQYVYPNVRKGSLYSFCARGRDNTCCPVWREDRDPAAINYGGECFYYTARDAADKNIIYLTAVHRAAGYGPITIDGTLLRKGYNAKTGYTDTSEDVIEGAIAVCGESSCRTDAAGNYKLTARCPSGNSLRYLISVNGQTSLREVVVSSMTVRDTVTLNPENGTLLGALSISFAETDANSTVLVLNGTHSKLIVSDDGGYAYQQSYRKQDGTFGTKTALERLTKVVAVIRDTDGNVRATFNAERDEEGHFTCDLEHASICGGDRVFLKLTTDRLADTLAEYDEAGNLVNEAAVMEKGNTEYAEVYSGYRFAESRREEIPITADINCLPKYSTGILPFIGEAGYDFNLGPVNLAIEERDGCYMLRFGVSVGRILEYCGKLKHMSDYSIGTNGRGEEMYGADFLGEGNLQASYTAFIRNMWNEVFGKQEDKNNPAAQGSAPAKLGGLAWRFDVVVGVYLKFSRLQAYGGGMNGRRSDFYFTGIGAYLGLQAGYNITHYWVIPALYIPVYVGLQFDASLVGTIGGSIDPDNMTRPLTDMSSMTSGRVDIGQNDFDTLDGSVKFSIIGTLFAGVGIYRYLGIRGGGRIICVGLWEPQAREDITEDSGTIAFVSVGGWLDIFLFSVPILCTFDPIRSGLFEEYMTQTNAPEKVSAQVGELSFRRPYSEKASVWKGSRPATRSAFSEASVQTLVEDPYEHPEAKLVSLKNGDVMLAFIDKLPTEDLIDRTVLKLARYRDGKWGEPITVQPDDRADFQPSLCETKDGKVLLSWISTDLAWERKDTNLDFLKSLDVFSAVIDPETMAVSELTQLTDDEYYDSAPNAVCDPESGEYAVWYTKASAEDYAADGSTVERTAEELLNVYANGSIIAFQLHADAGDGKGARWLFDYYFPSEYATEADRDYLLENWNGQRFLSAPVPELDIDAANIADLTMTTYNGLAALAYTVDADSSNDTVTDKELFVQYYRFGDHKLFVPVRLTDDAVADATPQFARSTGENAETLLFWLRDSKQVTYLSVSDLIREGTADDGTILDTYRVGENHESSDDLSRLYSHIKPGGAEPDGTMQWSNFRTAVTDDDIYVVWSQPVEGDTEKVELYASAYIRSDETEHCGTDWSNPYRLTYDGKITDTPELAVDTNGNMLAVYNSFRQEVTDDPENPLLISDLMLCAATLVPCGAVEVKDITLSDTAPTAGQQIEADITLVNNGLTFAEGYELSLYQGDTLLETVTSDLRMRPAQEENLKFTWTIPADFDGMTLRASVKETGGEWTNTHERESAPLRAEPDLAMTAPVTYQDKTGFRMSFDITNNGGAASTAEDTLKLTQTGPFNNDCGLTLEEKAFAEQSLAGIGAGETKHFDIAVNAPSKAFEKFGYVSCIADILHGDKLQSYTAVDIMAQRVIDIRWNGGELPEALTMNIGESEQVSVTAVPAGSAYASLYSSDPEVVAIEDGKLVAKGAGTAEITGILLPSGETFGPVTVTVEGGAAPTDPCEGYTDIDRSAWYHDAADFVIANGIMGSTKSDEKTFEPFTACTRSMIAQMLYSLEGKPAVSFEAKFPDVKEGQWFTDAVMWAYKSGIVTGYDNGSFGPNDKVTREQMAVILKAYAEKVKGMDTTKTADLSKFADANKVTWSKPYIAWAVAEGLLSGKAAGDILNLDPQGNATRAEVAAIMRSFITNIIEAK